MVVLLVSLLALFILLYYVSKTKYSYWKKRRVPSLPVTTFLGNYGDYILQKATMFDQIESICKKLPEEPIIGAYMGTVPVLIVKDPEYLKLVLTKDFYYFNVREVADYSDREVVTRNLFFTYGDNWRILRQNLTPIFSSAKMKAMFPLVASKANDLQKLISLEYNKSQVINVKSLCARFAMDVICSCVFGVESKVMTDEDVQNNVFRQIADSLFAPSTSRALRLAVRTIYPWLIYNSGQTVFPDKIHKFFSNVMQNVMDSRNGIPTSRNDVIDVMLGIKNENYIKGDPIANFKTNSKEKINLKVDDNMLIAQCIVFFAAGFETSSATMTFLLYELAKHPQIQEQASKEVDEYLEKTGGNIEFSCMTDLPFLEQCVDETLRLYPVLGVITREVYEDYTFPINGVKIEKGLAVHIPVYHMHYSAEYWPEPEEFRPERFSPQNKPNIRPYTYMPFGEGPRICIGLRFAKMQLMAGLVSLLSKYTVMVTAETPKKVVFDTKTFSTASVDDIKLRFLPK